MESRIFALIRMSFAHDFMKLILLLVLMGSDCVGVKAQLSNKQPWTLTDSLVYIGSVYWCLKEEGYITNTQAGESVRQVVNEFMDENKISMDRLMNILSDNDFEVRLEAEINAAGGCRQLAESFMKEVEAK
jgi:hypothetical protein